LTHKASTFVSYASAVGLAAGVFFADVNASDAAQATANIGATVVDNGGGIGTPPVTTPDPTPDPVVTDTNSSTTTPSTSTPTSASEGAIVVTPGNPGSNLGFNPPAPVAVVVTPPTTDSDGTPIVSDGANEVPRASRPFSSGSATNVPFGTGASVGVSGSPNQTYSVLLPSQTMYSSGGNLVSLNNFAHNGGLTPSMDGFGGDIFSIGASIVTVPIGEQSLIRTIPGTNANQAVILNGDSAEAVPSPNFQSIISGTDGLNTNDNQRQEILAAAFTARSPFVNIVVSYN